MKKIFIIFISLIYISGYADAAMIEEANEQLQDTALLLSLDESITYALSNGYDLKTKREELEQLEAKLTQARSELFPQLKLSGTHTRYYNHPFVRFDSSTDFDAKLDQAIYSGGRISANVKQAKYDYEAAQENQRRLRQAITYNVTSSFYNIILAGRSLQLAKEEVVQVELKLASYKKRFESGEADASELIRYEAELKASQATLAGASKFYELTKNQFKFLLGIDPLKEIALEGDIVYAPSSFDMYAQLKRALIARPDLKGAEKEVKADEAGLASARSGFLPSVSLNLTDTFPEQAALSSGRSKYDDYLVGYLKVTYQLFDGFLTKGKSDEAKARIAVSKALQGALQDEVKLEVIDAFLGLNSADEAQGAAFKEMELIQEIYNRDEARFSAGLVNTIELGDSKLTLARAKLNYEQAVVEYIKADAALKLSAGED